MALTNNNDKGNSMKKNLVALVASGIALTCGTAIAQDDEGSDGPASVEIYACSFNEGKGREDWDAAAGMFNEWADDEGVDDYLAYTLAPFYSGPEQEFDVLWLGVSPSGNAMGQLQDKWIATGGEVAADFGEAAVCGGHAGFAVMQLKEPPERDNPEQLIIAFSDCTLSDGVTVDDVLPAMNAWADAREATGSTAGHWALFPTYGGGGETFDFKYVAAWQNFADMGTDFDTWGEVNDEAGEGLAGKLSCDSSRVYVSSLERSPSAE